MLRLPVESTDLVSIGYDAKERILEVEFKEHRVYQYSEVTPDVYERFMRADSYGEYFFATINKHYRYKRVDDGARHAVTDALLFVTGNVHKLRDARAVCERFGIQIEGRSLPVDEIQSHNPQHVVTHKVKQAFRLAGGPVVVQDTFWNILALRGFPGAYMSHVAGWLRAEDFLALMQDKPDRTVIRTHNIAYYDGKRLKIFTKDFVGSIANQPRGTGNSIDQIVITSGQNRTIAEIREAEDRSSIPPTDSAWHDFAKWYNLHRRISKSVRNFYVPAAVFDWYWPGQVQVSAIS